MQSKNRKELEKELKSLYAERAYSKEKIGDVLELIQIS